MAPRSCSTCHHHVSHSHFTCLQEERIKEAVEEAGFEATIINPRIPSHTTNVPSGNTTTIHLSIQGMTCSSCVASIETALSAIPGVQRAVVALATEKAEVEYEHRRVSKQDILDCLADAGFDATFLENTWKRDKVCVRIEGLDAPPPESSGGGMGEGGKNVRSSRLRCSLSPAFGR